MYVFSLVVDVLLQAIVAAQMAIIQSIMTSLLAVTIGQFRYRIG